VQAGGTGARDPVWMNMANTFILYLDFFGLKKRPFSIVPDPEFLFWSDAHLWAYSMLEYGMMTRAPITLITGEIGSGKTTLLNHLIKTQDEDVTIGLISNAHGDRGELLRWVLMSLNLPASSQDTYVDLFARFQHYVIAEYAEGRRVVLIFDEAQNLSRESLEEVRMFTNINSNNDELLQIILVGQPELRDIVRRPDMVQFAQRISSNFHLNTMTEVTVRAYVMHRMKVAGATHSIFTRSAIKLIAKATGGVPRLVNQICDLALVYCYSEGGKQVTAMTIRRLIEDGVFFAPGLAAELAAEPHGTPAS
jgi:general secretion pathway protein A